MPPRKTTKPYRVPTELEREFLKIVTFGNPELERQVVFTEIADYDATGWCDVNVLHGPPSPHQMVDGPAIDLSQMEGLTVDVARPDVPPTVFLVKGGEVVEIAPFPPTGTPRVLRVETILWMNDRGMLYTIEVISIGDGYVSNPYSLFVDIALRAPHRLEYPTTKHG